MEFVTNILNPLMNDVYSIIKELIRTYESEINFIAAIITIFGIVVPSFNWIFLSKKSEPDLDLESLEDEIDKLKCEKGEVEIQLDKMHISYGNVLANRNKIKRRLNYYRLWTICSTLAILITGFALTSSFDKNNNIEKINESINTEIDNYRKEINRLQDTDTNLIQNVKVLFQKGNE